MTIEEKLKKIGTNVHSSGNIRYEDALAFVKECIVADREHILNKFFNPKQVMSVLPKKIRALPMPEIKE